MIFHKISTQKVVSVIDLRPYEEQGPTLMNIFEWIKKPDMSRKAHVVQGSIFSFVIPTTSCIMGVK